MQCGIGREDSFAYFFRVCVEIVVNSIEVLHGSSRLERCGKVNIEWKDKLREEVS